MSLWNWLLLQPVRKMKAIQPNKENRKGPRREKDTEKQKQGVQFVEKLVSTQGGCKALGDKVEDMRIGEVGLLTQFEGGPFHVSLEF